MFIQILKDTKVRHISWDVGTQFPPPVGCVTWSMRPSRRLILRVVPWPLSFVQSRRRTLTFISTFILKLKKSFTIDFFFFLVDVYRNLSYTKASWLRNVGSRNLFERYSVLSHDRCHSFNHVNTLFALAFASHSPFPANSGRKDMLSCKHIMSQPLCTEHELALVYSCSNTLCTFRSSRTLTFIGPFILKLKKGFTIDFFFFLVDV